MKKALVVVLVVVLLASAFCLVACEKKTETEMKEYVGIKVMKYGK